MTGYTSVRTELPNDQRAEAEQVYAVIREKRSHNYKIEAGLIRRRSTLDVLAVFTRTLWARLLMLLAVQTR